MDRFALSGSPRSRLGLACNHRLGIGLPAGDTGNHPVLLNLFCPFTTAKVLSLKATVLLLQALVFVAVSGGLVLAAAA